MYVLEMSRRVLPKLHFTTPPSLLLKTNITIIAIEIPHVRAGRAVEPHLLQRRAVELHGGIGFTWECDVQFWVKRTMFDRTWLGSPRADRERIARLLGW